MDRGESAKTADRPALLAMLERQSLIGGDPIAARRMRQDYFTFDPTHKLWIADNHLPKISGTDDGIWRRIRVIPFTVSFAGADRDTTLADRLAAEAPGILAWLVRGCIEWRRDGLAQTASVRGATAEYRSSQDHLGRFIAESCDVGDDMSTPTNDLRAAYERWSADAGEKAWTATAVDGELGRTNKSRIWLGLAPTPKS